MLKENCFEIWDLEYSYRSQIILVEILIKKNSLWKNFYHCLKLLLLYLVKNLLQKSPFNC